MGQKVCLAARASRMEIEGDVKERLRRNFPTAINRLRICFNHPILHKSKESIIKRGHILLVSFLIFGNNIAFVAGLPPYRSLHRAFYASYSRIALSSHRTVINAV